MVGNQKSDAVSGRQTSASGIPRSRRNFMKFIAKLAKQGVMMALVAVVAAFVGTQVTVQQVRHLPVEGRGNGLHGIVLVDDKTKLCAAGC
jgi:hypothetical protein